MLKSLWTMSGDRQPDSESSFVLLGASVARRVVFFLLLGGVSHVPVVCLSVALCILAQRCKIRL